MLGVLTSNATKEAPCERTVRGQADRRNGSTPAAVGAGADDRDRGTPGDGADLQRPGVPAAGDGSGRRAPRSRARSHIWLVLGRGHARRTRRERAPGTPPGREDV